MVFMLPVAVLVAAQQDAMTQDSVTYRDGLISVVLAEQRSQVRIADRLPELPRTVSRQMFQLGETKVTFDKDGLLIEKNGWKGRSRLASVPTSDVLFTPEIIAEHRAMANRGEISLNVSAMNGAVAVEDKLYMWLRWERKTGESWLEGVFELDASLEQPTTKFIGKMPGNSFATGIANDRLRLDGEELIAPVRAQEGWGLGRFKLADGTTTFEKAASQAKDAFFVPGSKMMATVRATSYGTTIVGLWGPGFGYRETIESRGTLAGIYEPGIVVFRFGGTDVVSHGQTGAKMAIPKGAGFRAIPGGLVYWEPNANPKRVTVVDRNFVTRGQWPAAR